MTFGADRYLGSAICASDTSLPVGVLKCSCSLSASRRHLLQTADGVSKKEVQIEALYDLQRAEGYTTTSVADIESAYAALGTETVTVLKTDKDLATKFSVDTKNVGVYVADDLKATVVPTPSASIEGRDGKSSNTEVMSETEKSMTTTALVGGVLAAIVVLGVMGAAGYYFSVMRLSRSSVIALPKESVRNMAPPPQV